MRTVRHAEHVMGTVVSFELHLAGDDPAAGERAIRAACAVLHADDRTFSLWRADSPLSRVHRGELTLWEAPPEVAVVLDRSLLARRLSGGWFEPWLDGRFDPTGLVKGWSAMRALDALRVDGVTAAMVNAGGDVASFGEPEPGRPWNVGVRDPDDPARVLFAVRSPGAVATSGAYERGAHIRDPLGGGPAVAAASATVTAPELDIADALATALVAAGTAGLPLVDRIPDAEACILTPDGRMHATPGFPFAA